ncbi:MAG: isoprenyl transferase [Actinomycetales bacterium]|nr:isoprenyl transferase [Actinomycetales bacterium]
MRNLLYGLYRRRLRRRVSHLPVPRHVGIILDGNRRWAAMQRASAKHGHQAGAAKVREFLGWCDDLGVEVVTLWLLSTDNLSRDEAEVSQLLRIINDTVNELAESGSWRIHPMGFWDELPAAIRENLQRIKENCGTRDGMLVNVAVGYGGRREVVDAVRSLLQEHAKQGTSLEDLAATIDIDHIAEHLYTKGQPDPDLVIRTSGEQRLGGFLLWQSQYSEFWFCEAYWPDFREIDFLRAVRSYGGRHRRFGA